MTGDLTLSEPAGRDAPFGPTAAAGVSQADYVAAAIRQANERVFGSQSVSVSGQAAVDQTLHVDISLDPEIRARLDSLNSFDFTVPLGQAPTGRMDDDAAPRRGGGPH